MRSRLSSNRSHRRRRGVPGPRAPRVPPLFGASRQDRNRKSVDLMDLRAGTIFSRMITRALHLIDDFIYNDVPFFGRRAIHGNALAGFDQ